MKIIHQVSKLFNFRGVRTETFVRRQHAIARKTEGDPLMLMGSRESREYNSIKNELHRKGWESAIGLEVHAQIAAKTKIFSSAPFDFAAPVNTQVALLDAAIPGTLPALNRASVEAAVLTSMVLSCQINTVSTFDRKHYFYADLPQGYQITQQRNPLATNGALEFIVAYPGCPNGAYYHTSKIVQVQLEQDSGKSLHDEDAQKSLIDLNRAGIGLMEIVFQPDLRDGEEAGALIKELILILQRIQTCDCKMEEGSLRVDANISVNKVGEQLGVRTEVKNLGSVRSVVNAIEYEVKRQIKVLESGGIVTNETRSFDTVGKQTVPMRDKEMKQDYRFMPEPNLPPVRLIYDPSGEPSTQVNIASVRKLMKELPDVTRKRLVQKYGVRLQSAAIIVSTPGFLDYFLSVMMFVSDESGLKVANFLQNTLMEVLNSEKMEFTDCPQRHKDIADLVTFLENKVINLEAAQYVLKMLMSGDERTVEQIVKEENFMQINDETEIEKICLEVIKNNPKSVKGYKEKDQAKFLKKLLGAVNSVNKGKTNMAKASKIMQNLLKK